MGYPTLQTWLDNNQAADHGLLLLLVVVAIVLLWLAIGRLITPHYMEVIRFAFLSLFIFTGGVALIAVLVTR